jgi:uncharacterized membrane protein YebE (DUF533 family)
MPFRPFAATTLAVTLASAFTFGSAFAQTTPVPGTNTPSIDQRQANQQQRINQGVQSGQLTEKEAANMQKRQDKIGAMEDKAKADGTVTAKERAKIQHKQDHASRKIYQKKHNAKTAANPTGAASVK